MLKDNQTSIEYEESVVWRENKPYIDDTGIWVPVHAYSSQDTLSAYKLLISKELFVEAYSKWIAGEESMSKTFIEGVNP